MGAAAVPLMIAGAGMSAIGSIRAGQAQAASAEYNAKIAEMNSKLATQNAAWSGAEGEQQAGIAGLKAQEQAGAIKTAQAANNVDVNTGSAVGVQKSQAELAMLNEMNIRSNAARQAYGFETQAAGDTAQAALDKSQAKQDKISGYIGAAGSLLGGAGSASMYSNWLSNAPGTLPSGDNGVPYEDSAFGGAGGSN